MTQHYIDTTAHEAAARTEWQSDPNVRAEFRDNLAAFLAWKAAEAKGIARIFSRPSLDMNPRRAALSVADGVVQQFKLNAVTARGASVRLAADGPARGSVAGYAAMFGGTNRNGSRILPGAFRETRAPVPMLWGHDHKTPIGNWHLLREDGQGLWAEGSINLSLHDGRKAFELLRQRDVTGLSVGLTAKRGDFEYLDKEDVLEFKRADLLEISVVAVPAESRARVTTVGA